MNIGIIGLPKAGKTTIFNALTGQEAEVAEYTSGKVEPNVAIVDVGDPRVDELSRMYKPKKTIYAVTEFIDFVGGGASVTAELRWRRRRWRRRRAGRRHLLRRGHHHGAKRRRAFAGASQFQ